MPATPNTMILLKLREIRLINLIFMFLSSSNFVSHFVSLFYSFRLNLAFAKRALAVILPIEDTA